VAKVLDEIEEQMGHIGIFFFASPLPRQGGNLVAIGYVVSPQLAIQL
jgi:hypothetical protein